MAGDNDIKVETAVVLLFLLLVGLWSIDRWQHDRIEKTLTRIEQRLEQYK